MLANRVPMETAAHLQGLFYISLKFFIKIFLNEEKFSLLSEALGKEHSSMFPKSGAPIETNAHFQSLTEHILQGPQ